MASEWWQSGSGVGVAVWCVLILIWPEIGRILLNATFLLLRFFMHKLLRLTFARLPNRRFMTSSFCVRLIAAGMLVILVLIRLILYFTGT